MKKILSLVLCLLLLCALSVTAFAAEDSAALLDYVTDDAGLFTAEELAVYEATAKSMSEAFRCGIYFVALEDYTAIADGEPADVAEQIYDHYQLGYGENGDGVLMMVSDVDGSCALISQGSAKDALGDPQALLDEAVNAYGSGGYQGVLSTYLSQVSAQFTANLFLSTDTPVQPEKQQPEVAADPPTVPAAAPDLPKPPVSSPAQPYPAPVLDGYVTDLYGLLSPEEEAALEGKAAELSRSYGCGVYILIVDDFTQYGGGDAFTVAEDVFLACDLGEGPTKAGVLLMMSMADRDITILTNEPGEKFVGDDAQAWLEHKYLKEFQKNNWAKGFTVYLDKLSVPMKQAAKGKTMTVLSYPESVAAGVLVSLLGGLGLSFIIFSSLKNRLKSVFKASMAEEYVAQGGITITGRSDVFSHRTSTSRTIETKSSSSRSGSGSRSSSRGFSGRSSKF